MAGSMMRRHAAAIASAENNRDLDDDRADKTAEDKAGDRARFIARDLGHDPVELATYFERNSWAGDLLSKIGPDAVNLIAEYAAIKPAPTLAGWLDAYEPIAPTYRRACVLVTGLGAPARELATRSALETDGLAIEVFAVLGAELCADRLKVQPAAILAAPALNLCKRINEHASRIFDDAHGPRRAKAIAGTQAGRQRQSVVASLNVVLRTFGGALCPSYTTARERARGTPAHWTIAWTWADAPEPRPLHPTTAALLTTRLPQTAPLTAREELAAAQDLDDVAAEMAKCIPPPCGALEVRPADHVDDASDRARTWVEKRSSDMARSCAEKRA